MNKLRMLLSRTPDGSRLRRKAAPYMGIGAFLVVVLLAIPPAWEYTNSTTFCGETCHTMPPEYQTYLVSPHARVPCVDCHIGRTLILEQAIRKTGHMRLLFDTITGNYEYPIHVSSMRPARDTCERCHFPEKFSDDSLRERVHFRENVENAQYTIYLLMHTGGGSQREGLGFGIHWHVENPIDYIALDDRDQEIPWVRVTTASGETVEYFTEDFSPEMLEGATLKRMDCMTCHNRISHHIQAPREIMDAALRRGDIPTSIPNIRYLGEQVLARTYESAEEAHAAIEELANYYAENYPDYYAENAETVQKAIDVLIEQWDANNFVEQELNWNTHPNNIGHRDWPGCFRCHDGEHFSAEGEAVRLECNLCHSIPEVVYPTDIEPALLLSTGLEPESHLDSTWISRHHNEFDRSCANCHTVENPGGTSDTSFCSNSACHGVRWKFAGFDAPALAASMGMLQDLPVEELLSDGSDLTLTYADFQPLLEAECGRCHGNNPTLGLKVTDYASLMAGSNNGPVITPGDPEASRIVTVVSQGHFGTLTTGQIEALRRWIRDGAPEGAQIVEAAATYTSLQPVLVEACGECHSGEDAPAGLDVSTYDTLMAGGEDGPVITPGDPEASLIVEVLNEGHFARLTDDQMQLLVDWITAGAPESDTVPVATSPLSYASLQPVLVDTCGRCHSGEDAPAGLDVSTYETLMAGGEDGPVITPGDPEASLIVEVLNEGHLARLDDDQMQLLMDWIAAGAPESGGEASTTEPATTYASLQPVLVETCGRCHSGEDAPAGLDVSTYETLMAGGEDGPVIAPGDPDASLILQVLNEGHFARLDDDQMQLLMDWIAAGAPESGGEASTAEPATTYASLQPVLVDTCGKCHSGEDAPAGLDVSTYDTLMVGGEDGPVITPGDPEASLILEVLNDGHFARLDDDQMQLLMDWIAAGAPLE
ncbi:MAG: hypothetical protein Kow0077_22170 [Anaerolineae bacterium]